LNIFLMNYLAKQYIKRSYSNSCSLYTVEQIDCMCVLIGARYKHWFYNDALDNITVTNNKHCSERFRV